VENQLNIHVGQFGALSLLYCYPYISAYLPALYVSFITSYEHSFFILLSKSFSNFFLAVVPVWTQDLAVARQVLYHLTHCPLTLPLSALFYFSYFLGRSLCFLSRAGLEPPSSYLYFHVAGITGMNHHACLLKWGFANFLPRLPLNHDLPSLLSWVAGMTGIYHHTQLVLQLS
jgi:hypothetical protein